MPVPKSKQKKYGIIVATMQKHGRTLEQAKAVADAALDIGKHTNKKK